MTRSIPKLNRRAIGLVGLTAACLSLLPGCATPDRAAAAAGSGPVLPTASVAAAPAPVGPLTVEQAVQQALTSDPRLASLRAAVNVARQQRRAATDLPDPEVQFDWGGTDAQDLIGPGSTSGDKNGQRTRLSVPMPNPFLEAPRVDARTADLRAAEADLRAATWLATCEVRRLFTELDYLANDMAVASELARLNSEILKAAKSRAEQGAATTSDVVAASRRTIQVEDDLDQVRQHYKVAQRQLAALLNLPSESLRIATNALAMPSLRESAGTFDRAEEGAMRSRADVAALHWRTLAARDNYREARNKRLPWIKELRGTYRANSDEWWAGFAIDLPIFTLTRNHADEVLLAQSTLTETKENEGKRQVGREIRDAVDELEESRRQQDRYHVEVAPLIAEMSQALSTLQNAPNVMPDQVAAMELQLVEARRADQASSWRYRLALINLERALGAPPSASTKITPAP